MKKVAFFGLTPAAVLFAKEIKKNYEVETFGFDNNVNSVDLAKDEIDHAIIGSIDNKSFIESYSESAPFDTAFIFAKENTAANLLCCEALIELGVENIYSVYKNESHRNLLNRIGVHTDFMNDLLQYRAWELKAKNGGKPILYLDMDGVLADLGKGAKAHPDGDKPEYKAHPDEIPGVFRNLPPIEGAIEAVNKLLESNKYDMYILTTAPWDNPTAWSDKRHWIEDHFGKSFEKKMIITHRKDLLIGDYLIDDRTARGAKDFTGLHLHFGLDYEKNKLNKFPIWSSILEHLI